MAIYALTLAYKGDGYSGWQVQKNAPSVQSAVQDAVEKVFGTRLGVTGCSRTDSGVHALAYVCHIETEKAIQAEKLPLALNMHLPRDISVLAAEEKPQDFHARYSALGKEYVYLIRNTRVRDPFMDGGAYLYPFYVDAEKANRLGKAFVGTHNFGAFMSAGSKITDTVRTVYYFDVHREGDYLRITTGADGFLYNMVRIMVGTLLKACKGDVDITAALNNPVRSMAGPTAPALGLYLNRVFYSKPLLEQRIAQLK